MSNELLEQIEPILPIDFFSFSYDLNYSKAALSFKSWKKNFILPDTSALMGEEPFGEISVAWNEDALFIHAHVHKPFEQTTFPNSSEGDSLELFFDTRDLKTAGFLTRFCHHFIIFPQEVNEHKAQEITRFRTEDIHPLCDPQAISVEGIFRKKDYELNIVIPSYCLHGYDPQSFDRIGFTYRLNRYQGPSQHFAVSSKYFAIEQHPSLWGSLRFIKKTS
jgi:hypothetical protein